MATETSSAEPLRVAAASDLQLALPKLVDRFQAQTGIATSFLFGASGRLAEQIKQGRPSTSSWRPTRRSSATWPTQVRPAGVGSSLSRGSLVLAVYHELGGTVGTLADLTKPEVKKIALANPATAPYGKAGRQALEKAGLWTKLQPKIVLAESVGQALLYAQKGDAEAALVGRAIATVPEVRAVEVDPGSTTRSCRRSGSWRLPHGRRTPRRSCGSFSTRRGKGS